MQHAHTNHGDIHHRLHLLGEPGLHLGLQLGLGLPCPHWLRAGGGACSLRHSWAFSVALVKTKCIPNGVAATVASSVMGGFDSIPACGAAKGDSLGGRASATSDAAPPSPAAALCASTIVAWALVAVSSAGMAARTCSAHCVVQMAAVHPPPMLPPLPLPLPLPLLHLLPVLLPLLLAPHPLLQLLVLQIPPVLTPAPHLHPMLPPLPLLLPLLSVQQQLSLLELPLVAAPQPLPLHYPQEIWWTKQAKVQCNGEMQLYLHNGRPSSSPNTRWSAIGQVPPVKGPSNAHPNK